MIINEEFFFDKYSDVNETNGTRLPHWHQENKIQFVTFRLADSLPQSQNLLLRNRLNNDSIMEKRSKHINQLLDNGYGCCILRDIKARKLLKQTLHFYDNQKYQLLSYVIMPNHVHMLLLLFENNVLSAVVQNLKRYSSKLINKTFNLTTKLWQREYYDTIIRSKEHFLFCLNYIEKNPRNLTSNQFDYYLCPALRHKIYNSPHNEEQ